MSVHVRHFDLDSESAHLVHLSAAERVRAASFHFERDARRWAVGRSLLRSTLGGLLCADPAALVFESGPFGKPFLPDCPLGFSVSHSGSAFLIALAWNTDVGVDIERLRDDFAPEAIALQVFSFKEQAALEQAPLGERPAAFLAQWTAKEAYVKALGTGLSFPLTRLTLTLNPDGRYTADDLTADGSSPAAVSVCRLDAAPGYTASLAYVSRNPKP